MAFVTVEAEKCIFCGACTEECAFHLIEMKTRDSLPTPRDIPVRSAEERCLNCGHCVVVCPTSALTISVKPHGISGRPAPPGTPARQDPKEMTPIRPELKVTREQMAQLLMGRRTHRAYQDRQVPRQTIEEIINVARYAPSGHNNQSCYWLIVTDKKEVRRLGQTVIDFMKANRKPNPGMAYPWDYHGSDSDVVVDLWEKGIDSVFRGAPHTAILYGPKGMENLYAGREMHAIRLTYFELAAIPYDIVTVWNGFFVAALQLYPPAQEAVSALLPEGNIAYDSMSFGYPKNLVRRIPQRNKAPIIWK